MTAHHRVHDYACCHLQADCQDQLWPPTLDYEYGYLYLYWKSVNMVAYLIKTTCGNFTAFTAVGDELISFEVRRSWSVL